MSTVFHYLNFQKNLICLEYFLYHPQISQGFLYKIKQTNYKPGFLNLMLYHFVDNHAINKLHPNLLSDFRLLVSKFSTNNHMLMGL